MIIGLNNITSKNKNKNKYALGQRAHGSEDVAPEYPLASVRSLPRKKICIFSPSRALLRASLRHRILHHYYSIYPVVLTVLSRPPFKACNDIIRITFYPTNRNYFLCRVRR